MPGFLFAVRCVMALVWFYNGLWLKIWARDVHHLAIVTSATANTGIEPGFAMIFIGGGETLLALGLLSGLWPRFVNAFQICLLLSMNIAGIILGGGAIERPVGLLIANLPLMLCAALVMIFGPGRWTIPHRHGA